MLFDYPVAVTWNMLIVVYAVTQHTFCVMYTGLVLNQSDTVHVDNAMCYETDGISPVSSIPVMLSPLLLDTSSVFQ